MPQDDAVLDAEEADLFVNRRQPINMISYLNKHRRDRDAKRAKAMRDATEATQQQHTTTEGTPQHKDTTNANFTTVKESTAPAMEEATTRQPHTSSETTVQIQAHTPPSSEPSNTHNTRASIPIRGWGLGTIVDSVSRFVPTFNRAPLRIIQEVTAESQTPSANAETSATVHPELNTRIPQTDTTQLDVTHSPAVEATKSSRVKRPSHNSVDQRKASSKRKKAQISAEKKQAEFMEARKLEMNNEIARRVNEALKAQYEADKAAHPGKKRKRYSPPVIPNPVGVSYGFDPEFFGSDSDSDEETAPESPSLRPAKRVRLNLEPTTYVFPSDEVVENQLRARPYTGTMFADPPRKIVASPSPSITFTVPEPSDSDDDNEDEAPTPAVFLIGKGKAEATDSSSPQLPIMPSGSSKKVTETISASERQALIDAEYARIYAGLKDSYGSSLPEWQITFRTEMRIDMFKEKLPPVEPEAGALPSGDQAEPESLARARQKATQYTPKRPSALRSVSRISSSSIGTPSDAGNNVKVYEPTENIAKKPANSTRGNDTKPLRGILKSSGGNALREVSGNMVPTKVNERQISANEIQVSKATENQVGSVNDCQVVGKQVGPQFEQPLADPSVATALNEVSPTDLVSFHVSLLETENLNWDPIVLQQLNERWTQADVDRAIQVGAAELSRYIAQQPSSTTN